MTVTEDGDVQVQRLQTYINPTTGEKNVIKHILVSLARKKNKGGAVIPLKQRKAPKKQADFFLPVKAKPGAQVHVTEDCGLRVRTSAVICRLALLDQSSFSLSFLSLTATVPSIFLARRPQPRQAKLFGRPSTTVPTQNAFFQAKIMADAFLRFSTMASWHFSWVQPALPTSR